MAENSAEARDVPSSIEVSEVGIPCRPFVKWVGGKGQLVEQLLSRIPTDYERYYEPFVGGGALLFGLQPRRATISDVNAELINAYLVVQNEPQMLLEDLARHRYERDYFYSVRDADRSPEYLTWTPVQRASRFIFLNKTCFNGLYRVNSSGFFNTPFGRYSNPKIVDIENIKSCNAYLRQVEIRHCSFADYESEITDRDFVYFDPPYVPLSLTSNFTSYSKVRFDQDMQQQLYDFCCRLDTRKIRFMLSNSSAPFVIELYKKFRVERVSASRAINSVASKRGQVDEVIVTNF